MKHSKKLLIFLITALLLMAMAISVVACTPPDTDDGGNTDDSSSETVTESLLLANGKFANTSGSSYVKTATSWTLTAGVWSKSATGLVTGAVDLTEDVFNNNKGTINSDLAYPGIDPNTSKDEDDNYQDTNALVISMSGSETYGSAYYYSSKTTLSKGKYYKLSVDVWTDLIFDEDDTDTDERGASIIVSEGYSASSATVARTLSINTQNEWKTYTLYIEASKLQSNDIYVQLWLGYGPSKYKVESSGEVESPYNVKGTAMFDNVILETVKEDDYNSALVDQYNSLYPEDPVTEASKAQKVLSVNNNGITVVSYDYANRNFVYGAGIATGSTSKYFLSAKQSGATGYTVNVGKEDIEDSSDFPSYTDTTSPVGIFDLSKLYYTSGSEEEGYEFYNDSYNRIYSGFHAPKASDLGFTYENGAYKFSRSDNPADTNALLIYHSNYAISGAGFTSSNSILIEKDKYYAVTVMVYIWIPEMTAPTAPTDTEASDYQTKLDEYNEKLNEYTTYNTYFDGTQQVYATMRLSGTTTAATDTNPEIKTDGSWGSWQRLTLKVKGNELADRTVKLELWYGEGEWESDTLYPGGCIFDNIRIEKYDSEDEINAEYAGEISHWAEVKEDAYNGFGLNGNTDAFTAITTDATSGWTYSLVDNKTHVDMTAADSNLYAGIVSGTNWDDVSTIPALNGISKPGDFSISSGSSTNVFDYVMLNHAEYTASKLTFKPADADTTTLQTKINRFYRLSMWVNTQNLKSGSTFKISVYDKETDALINSSATQSSLAFTEWTEVSFVFRANGKEADSMYIVVEFGSGDIYTPASHAKGAIFLTALTWSEISYNEYKNASGDYLKSINLASSSSSDSSITNSDFSNISDDNFDIDEDDDKVFDDNGNMVGVAKPTGWTASSVAYALTAPTLTKDGSKITWKHVANEVTHYYIYSDKVVVDALTQKTENQKLVNIIEAGNSSYYTEEEGVRTYSYTPASTETYYVRAVVIKDGKLLYASDLSSGKKVDSVGSSPATESYIESDVNGVESALDSVKTGIIDVKNFGGTGIDLYPQEDGKISYTSPASSNVLRIHSDYPTYVGYTNSSSASLSANSYYRLSVWVKTVDGAKASVTLKNSSKILKVTNADADQGEYVGYTGIDTEGAWVRYDIYIVTNMSSASLTLELYLGNKYANNTTAISDENSTYVSSGLSAGTVYFDDVMLTKLTDEDAYNELLIKNDEGEIQSNTKLVLSDNKDVTGSFYANEYIFTTVDYHTDSFDSFTVKTTDDDDNAAETLLGNTVGAYSHDTQTAVYNTEGDVADNDYPNHVYGVYSIKDDFTELVKHMTNTEYASTAGHAIAEAYDEAKLNSFLKGTDVSGNNYLMMANITRPSAQFYKSNSMTMSATSYYKITFKAKLLSPASKNAEFRFIYDSSANKWESIAIAPSDNMVEYTFYYSNETTSSVTAYLGFYLGSYDAKEDADKVENYMAGILILDDVSVEKLEEDDFTADKEATEANPELTGKYASYVSEAEESTPVDDDDDDDTDEDDGDRQISAQVWLILSSVVIGVILIAVIVVLLYRKLKGKVDKKLRKVKVESKMPADLEAKKATDRQKGKDRKKDISSSDYDD